MSEIRATTISDETGNGPISLNKQNAAKAWANINGTASPPSFRDSLNFSSITDHSVGDQTVTVTSAMANINYCIQGSTSWQAGASRNIINIATNKTVSAEAPTTTSTRYEIFNYNGSGSGYDGDFVMISFNGDLA